MVGQPLPTEGMHLEERDALNDRAHEAVGALLSAANARVQEMLPHG
jgi:hypothetical protein